MDELLPKLRLAKPDTGDKGVIEPSDLFQTPMRAYWLEIGFGAGEHLAAMASNNPDVGFIGCEPYVNGVASLLAMIEARGLSNVRIYDDDVRDVLPRMADNCFERVFLLYPDPWPKKRHNQRRMVNDGSLATYARILKDRGEFRFASDSMDYCRWTLAHGDRNPDLHWMANGPDDWRQRPADMIETRYESKARSKGESCVYLRYSRKVRQQPGA